MNSGENAPAPEIVIIRRKLDDGDGGHHGGMWKIAFADFMTAMMAFFLVMWLINATDEKVLNQVATYFNPIKLPDVKRAEKGLQTSDGGGGHVEQAPPKPTSSEGETEGKAEEHGNPDSQQKTSDAALFADPYGVLAKLAAEAVRVPLPVEQPGIRKDEVVPKTGGTAFRDPFDPEFRKNALVENGGSFDPRISAPGAEPGEAVQPNAPALAAADVQPLEQRPEPNPQPEPEQPAAKTEGKPAPEHPGAAREQAPEAPNAAETKASLLRAGQLDIEIKDALHKAGLQDLPQIEVEVTKEGLLISLTDKLNFEMFPLASAQPRPELVVALENIGRILQGQKGSLVIRGHTDGRPFRSRSYDNWRLSSARAHMAYYMLSRGGIPEERFDRIEGHADRHPKVPGDLKAAANRRIEILLKQDS